MCKYYNNIDWSIDWYELCVCISIPIVCMHVYFAKKYFIWCKIYTMLFPSMTVRYYPISLLGFVSKHSGYYQQGGNCLPFLITKLYRFCSSRYTAESVKHKIVVTLQESMPYISQRLLTRCCRGSCYTDSSGMEWSTQLSNSFSQVGQWIGQSCDQCRWPTSLTPSLVLSFHLLIMICLGTFSNH